MVNTIPSDEDRFYKQYVYSVRLNRQRSQRIISESAATSQLLTNIRAFCRDGHGGGYCSSQEESAWNQGKGTFPPGGRRAILL